ncbi:RagB/SusD family nutrient uptake outer membrane protein [Capnocytophaga catalasegens]|uniref:Outer membrane protein n=1 Tax=Capnocytophaga catalasegens TaxID=1004260 RepID=A0AAV5AVS1_9FLAO|nr:RagB/SusD family nutrient uptake outer membrane protein [Capnocytophaga catalasegens]GIZ16218.1 outer membrane protein [Capnocytophaga catalasegens]GJM49446.1 outer membrane protein [Capnocytophaga catalasegens]GJM53648.1 outer membrane protein [Capnocytophaga catalasegens]
MKKYNTIKILGVALTLSLTACMKDLDQFPIDPDSRTEKDVFASPEEAKGVLAKVYASFNLSGQEGPTGKGDLDRIDEGYSQFTRLYFVAQELTTETAVNGWSDQTIQDFHAMRWSTSDIFLNGLYNRIGQQISLANDFVNKAQVLASDPEVRYYIAEARFLRAYSYYCQMDLFGNVPLTTRVQNSLPNQNTRAEIFAFVESELKAIESELKASGSNEYGRVDVVAAQALLSRLYLNAEVFIGQNRYTDCVTYSQKAIASTYTLNTTDANNNGSGYDELFLADNHANGAQKEFIFVLPYDGIYSTTWGGTTFLVNGSIGGDMKVTDYGVSEAWAGTRTTKEFVNKFETKTKNAKGEPIAWNDKRAMFFTNGQSLEITDISQFKNGYAVTKFKNITSTGMKGSDPNGKHSDTDLPLIRLAEIYLNYAEAVVRGGGGDAATALQYVNAIRTRAGVSTITSSQLTADFILDERARELYWEGVRRTDLIRYGKFTSADYLWTFKGGAVSGVGTSNHRNLFPIPADVIRANAKLKQNTGY